MSMKALEWAMYDVPAEMAKGSLLRILLALADHADTEGRGAFPSQKRLCALTVQSPHHPAWIARPGVIRIDCQGRPEAHRTLRTPPSDRMEPQHGGF